MKSGSIQFTETQISILKFSTVVLNSEAISGRRVLKVITHAISSHLYLTLCDHEDFFIIKLLLLY